MRNLIDSITLSLLRTTAIETLGWTLLHFLWQGTLIALILAVLVWLLRNRHPSLRYGLSCVSLAVMLACPIVTYLVLDSRKSAKPSVETQLPPQPDVAQPVLVADNAAVQPPVNTVVFAPEGGTGTKQSWLERNLKPWLPYLVVFWGIGVLVLSIRLLGGLWVLRKLRTRLTKPVSTMLMAQLNSVAERLGLARTVQLRESLAVTVPLVVGWLKPMILLPSSVMSGLSVKQLEMILAHELAHIRRHDYLVNLLQSVIETLLFYHPAVWWVSGKIRHERELCCDDLAIKVCGGDKQSYAQALADLDDLRPNVQLVQAATGGSLVNRVLRLVDQAITKSLDPRQWMVGLSVITISLVMFTVIGLNLTIAQDDEITLRLAVSDEQGRPTIEPYVLDFIEQVKTLSNGKITIEPTWDAGSDTEAGYEAGVIEHVTGGDFELGIAASRAWNGAGVTSFDALQAPFLITNDALAEAVAASDIATKMLEGMSSAGVVGLTLWPEDLRHPFALLPHEPILSPEDFAGLNIRTPTSGVSYALIEALGATPMLEDSGYEVAESGLRGAILSLAGISTATGNVTFFPKYQVIFANGAAFEKLSDEQRTVIREAATETQRKAIGEHPREVDAATDWCAGGGSIALASDEQVAAFEKAAQPVFDQIEQDPLNAELIAAIRDLKANTEPSPGAEACGPAPTQQNLTPSTDTEVWSAGLPPNGVWQVELTPEDLESMGLEHSSAVDWAGLQTWTFQDGNGVWQLQGIGSLYCKNTYEVVESVVRFSYKTDCTNLVHDIHWRLEDDGLHLQLVTTKNSPTEQFKASFEAKPWQKIGEPSIDMEVWEKGLPPNGTWQVALTAEDIVKMGVSNAEAVNWVGSYAWKFQDSKATLLVGGAIEQTNSGGCEANTSVVEDVVRFIYTEGSGCGGEVDDIQWRLDDDGLHLQLVDINNFFRLSEVKLHSNFLRNQAYLGAKPWQKIE
jgi:TRAP-type C4-dicarboxylate transport system substrate-binding protein/beta-lactamase regulating signal transducer with metallopeptidase domain